MVFKIGSYLRLSWCDGIRCSCIVWDTHQINPRNKASSSHQGIFFRLRRGILPSSRIVVCLMICRAIAGTFLPLRGILA